jgi:LysR family transcriptional regulator, hydrogen peroxide-inducible genes activator
MEMQEIRYFLTLCDTLNFRRAATRCNVTQPALSRAIRKLEQELGGFLFRRERQQTHLTELGRLVRPQFEEIAARAKGVEASARQFLKLENTPLRLGAMCTIGPAIITRFLKEFSRKNPTVEITLRDGTPKVLTQLLLDDAIDFAIMAQPNPFDERLESRLLYLERFVVAFGLQHPFESQNAISLSDMHGQIYLRRINCEYREFFADLLKQRGLALRVSYQTEREDWIQSLVAGGVGVCFLPEFSASVGGLRTRPLIEPHVDRSVSLVSVLGREQTRQASSFLSLAVKYDWPRSESTGETRA